MAVRQNAGVISAWRAPAYNGGMKAFLRGMGKFGRMLWRGLPFLLLLAAAVIVFVPQKSKEAEARTVVRVWNIDTFEGGKGSRTAFLKSVARELQGGGVLPRHELHPRGGAFGVCGRGGARRPFVRRGAFGIRGTASASRIPLRAGSWAERRLPIRGVWAGTISFL